MNCFWFITLIICLHVSRVLELHTEITEHTELRIALLSLHLDGKHTLINLCVSRKGAKIRKVYSAWSLLSTFLSSFIVHLSTFTSELQNLRTRHLLSTFNFNRSPSFFPLRSFASLRELIQHKRSVCVFLCILRILCANNIL